MKLCRFATARDRPALGIVEGEEVVDLSSSPVPPEPARALDEVGQVGDSFRVEIEGIGELVNTVVEEPDGFLAPAPDVS